MVTIATQYEPHRRVSDLPLGDVLFESGTTLRHVYFPIASIVSLLNVMTDGATAEIVILGNEGVIGVPPFMGRETSPSRAVMQSEAHAYRLPSHELKQEFTGRRQTAPVTALYAGLDYTNGANRRLQSTSLL